MKIKRFIYITLLLLSAQTVTAQNRSEFFKVVPTLDGSEPAWVIELYSETPNVLAVVDLYHAYYRTNPLVKNLHTQNYKYWLRVTAEYVQVDGMLVVPTAEAEKERIQALHDQRNFEHATKTTEWLNMGPDRTYKNDGSLNLRPTQVNIFTMAVAPSDNDILYGAAEGGGIFKSTDHALNWELTTINEAFTNCQDIKVHPTNPDIVYVGSGEDIYKTLDGR